MKQKTEDRRQKTDPASLSASPWRAGSAIILAIVLTTLLAIVAVLFLLSSRVDMVGTSAVADNENLELAVDTVIAKISENLVLDVYLSGDPNYYADYPDPCNAWLACLEPYQAGSNYYWRQISDIYGDLYPGSQSMRAQTLDDYNDAVVPDTAADADGDGVSDSMWIQIRDVNSSKGKPIYAAVRVIDNGAMLNVNTGYKFNPESSVGASQMDVNIMSLSWRPPGSYAAAEETDLRVARSPVYQSELQLPVYEQGVVWKYGVPDGNFTPFDVSDELEMRNRFVLNHKDIDTRLEDWGGEFRNAVESTPYSSVAEWFLSAYDSGVLDPNYAYRHIATTYNYDRIIDPNGDKMYNINDANSAGTAGINAVYLSLRRAIDPSFSNAAVAQITANLIDYIDSPYYSPDDPRYDPNNDVTVVYDNDNYPHFGFERPTIYISEVAATFRRQSAEEVARSSAVELYNPYRDIMEPNDKWRLIISGDANTIPVTWPDNNAFKVILNENLVSFSLDPNADPNVIPVPEPNLKFIGGSLVSLQRRVNGIDSYITVDTVLFPDVNEPNTDDFNQFTYEFQRDISPHKSIRRLWAFSVDERSLPMDTQMSLGGYNYFESDDTGVIQAHPADGPFTNVGQFGELFYAPTYEYGGVGPDFSVSVNDEAELRINLADPNYQRLFNYLTVFDPTVDAIDNDGDGVPGTTEAPDLDELKIKGRININTAPWFVIAQLPWVTFPDDSLLYSDKVKLAQAIVAYRDRLSLPGGPDYTARAGMFGFRSTGELLNVTLPYNPCDSSPTERQKSYYDIHKYAKDFDCSFSPSIPIDQLDYPEQTPVPNPDLTPSDGAPNDFEERDAIFARISNLVTVRSDVFTAYILVRIGTDGPQKRVVAILDRSEAPTKPVKVIAIQQVPDPR